MLSFMYKYSPKTRKLKKYESGLSYGISYQAPSQFHTQHGLYCYRSYKNPHLPNPQNPEPKIAPRVDPIQVENKKTVGIDKSQQLNPNSFHAEYSRQLSLSPERFHRAKGPFVDFIDKNTKLISGPLLGIERTRNVSECTKKQLVDKRSKLIKARQSSLESLHTIGTDEKTIKNHSYVTKSSGQLTNNHLLIKSKLRTDRRKFNEQVQKLLQRRKQQIKAEMTETSFPLLNKLKAQKKAKSRLENFIQKEKTKFTQTENKNILQLQTADVREDGEPNQ